MGGELTSSCPLSYKRVLKILAKISKILLQDFSFYYLKPRGEGSALTLGDPPDFRQQKNQPCLLVGTCYLVLLML